MFTGKQEPCFTRLLRFVVSYCFPFSHLHIGHMPPFSSTIKPFNLLFSTELYLFIYVQTFTTHLFFIETRCWENWEKHAPS